MDAKNWAEVTAKANDVLTSSKPKKPDDVYAAHYFLLEAAKAQNNTPGMIASLEGMLASGFPLGPTAEPVSQGAADGLLPTEELPAGHQARHRPDPRRRCRR